MKVLIFIYSIGSGGAERVTANLANYWADKGWDITVVTVARRSLDFYALRPAVKRITLDLESDSSNFLSRLWQNLRRITALRQMLSQVRPDIALGMMTTANMYLALAALGLPKLRSIGAERTNPSQQQLGYMWETLRCYTYGLLNSVTVLTNESADWIKHNTHARRIAVIPNAVFFPLSIEEPQLTPTVICRPGRQILIAVGRLEMVKGYDWLIEAFSNLSDKHRNWDLVIIGEGHLRETIERQIQKLGLENRIFIPGRVGNVGEWYEAADLYVISSRYEGFPNTLVEAMAYGLSAVSLDCDTGPRDIIRHEVDGLLVPPGDVASLNMALDRLMNDPMERQRFALKAVEVRTRFSIEKIMDRWESLFEDILNEKT